MTPVAKYLRTLVPEFHARTDGELLTEFLLQHGEAPIVEILRRHGNWIWATCRRMLNHADAEDAFQATFLILTQRARKLQHSANIGPWLHRVAFLTARNLQRKRKHTPLSESIPIIQPITDLQIDLDEAICSLPEKYRAPVVLCQLQKISREEAARLLDISERTLATRLTEGLQKLRLRLEDYQQNQDALPDQLSSKTTRLLVAFPTASALAAVSPTVLSLTHGVLKMYFLKKIAFAGLLLACFGTGTVLTVNAMQDGKKEATETPKEDPVESKKEENSSLFLRLAQGTIDQKDYAALLASSIEDDVKLLGSRIPILKDDSDYVKVLKLRFSQLATQMKLLNDRIQLGKDPLLNQIIASKELCEAGIELEQTLNSKDKNSNIVGHYEAWLYRNRMVEKLVRGLVEAGLRADQDLAQVTAARLEAQAALIKFKNQIAAK